MMAPLKTRRNVKRQTRLQFELLSASSSAKDSYSQAVQGRLASVRFDGVRARRSPRVHIEDERESLPTPEPTSPTEPDAQPEKPSSPLSSLRTSPAIPPRFVDIEHTSISDDDDIVLPSSKRRKTGRKEPNIGKRTLNTSSLGTDFSPDPTPSKRGSRRKPQIMSTPARKPDRLDRRQPLLVHSDSSSPSRRLVSVDIPTPTKQLSNIASAESSGDEDDVMQTQPAIKKRNRTTTTTNEDPFVVEDDEIEYEVSTEDEPTSHKQTKKKRRGQDNFVVDDDDVEYITSDEESVKGLSSPAKSQRMSRNQRSPIKSKKSRRVQEELEEDLLDLQDSDAEESTNLTRTRGGPVTTERDKAKEHFELLKQRRAGVRGPQRISSGSDDEDGDADDGVDIDNIVRGSNRVEIVSDGSESVAGPSQKQEAVFFDDEDDDGFVVEDPMPSGRLGRPNTDIPLQFTSFASAKPKELFLYIIEWMIKNKISPAFGRDDDLYKLSFSRVDDQVKAQAGSRLISSAWDASFKWTILARPKIHVVALPGLDEELIRTCDACNKPNHPARYDFTFSGKAYHKHSLEPIDESDSEEEEEDDDDDDDNNEAIPNNRINYDEQGHVLASENMHFFLGRFCAANAEMGHKLTHWKYHLNEQVLIYLEEQGVLSAEAIVNREKLNKKKREKEAENIVDIMKETGMIAKLWQSFQDDLEDARIGMDGHEPKGGRSKARIGSVRVRRAGGVVGDWMEGGKFTQITTRR